MEQQKVITITLEEYKELLMIKGKYEELKEINKPVITYRGITFNDEKPIISPYKVTCDNTKREIDL